MKIVSVAQMQSLDRRASAEYKIPSLLLMENAGRGFVDLLVASYGRVSGKRVLILAGHGNNGGDGLVAARHLRMRGAEVAVYLFSEIEHVRGDARVSLDIWQATGGRLSLEGDPLSEGLSLDLAQCDYVVDALLGTGLSKSVTGVDAEAIERINACGKTVIAMDIPSGISADTGEVLGTAVRANATFTMALPKWGHFLQDGLEHRGQLKIVDIGIPPALVDATEIKCDWLRPAFLKGCLSPRKQGVHKGSLGHLLVVAGSVGKRGAAQMSALAALRTGTGLVTLALPRSLDNGSPLSTLEMMTLPLPESEAGTIALSAEKILVDALAGKQALAMGPGLSQHPETQALVRQLISECTLPMVIDADAINAIASDVTILKRKKGPIILTPHPGEMGRLIGKPAAEIQKDRFLVARRFAETWDVILVLKGAHTVIASPDGSLRVNNTGNPGMASAGTGDALTGIVSGLLAQGLQALDAASLGVWLHGAAGDLAAEERGEAGLLSSDLIEKMPKAISDYLRST